MKKILIVDDSREIRQLVKVTLGSEEFLVLEAESGEDGIEIAGKEIPDLIIMDIIFPGQMNGLEAIKEIKKNEQNKKCPIIILSGSGESLNEQSGLDAGAVNYFHKPFSPLDLIDKIEEILGISV